MTVSSGFFNSVNHDRLYDADQMSSIFDGIIEDGVYESIGEAFMVKPYAGGNDTVIVGTGRAWFDHTWTLNDAQFSITLDPPNTLLGRIDTIAIDVDHRDSVRANSIICIKGTPSDSPIAPSLVKEELHKQYPIADIKIEAGVSGVIIASKITYRVGTDDCPLVTGPLEAMNISNYFQQMESEFDIWHSGVKNEWTTWYDGVKDVFDDLTEGKIDLTTSVDNETIEFTEQKLRVKDRGITQPKLSFALQSAIGILDPSSWGYDEYYDFITEIEDTAQEEKFVNQYVTNSVLQTWTSSEVKTFYSVLSSNTSKETVYSRIPWSIYSLSEFRDLVVYFGSSKYSDSVGRSVTVNFGQYGNHTCRVIGVNKDTLASGGTALLTMQSTDIVMTQHFTLDDDNMVFTNSPFYTTCTNIYNSMGAEDKSMLKQASVVQRTSIGGDRLETFSTYMWLSSLYEINSNSYAGPNSDDYKRFIYDFWSSKNDGHADKIMKYQGTPTKWLTRDIEGWDNWYVMNVEGEDDACYFGGPGQTVGFVPVFCI